MYPSSSNSNRHTSFSSPNHLHGNHLKPSQDDDNYHPHYISLEDEHELLQPFSNNQESMIVAHEGNLQWSMEKCNARVEIRSNCKRGSRKDRHSKINTAQGPRDRRMRLSLDVAKKFFRLQDILGFDKASNTIEWLLNKSKPAIREELKQSCSASSASECEVMSGIDHDQSVEKKEKEKSTSCSSSSKEKKKVDRKSAREQARARARMRTTEKRNSSKIAGCDEYLKFRPAGFDQNVGSCNWIPNQTSSQVHYKQLGINVADNSSNTWSPSPSTFLFNYHHK